MIQVLSTNWNKASFLLIILSKYAKINQKISRGLNGMKNKEITVLDQAIHINKDDVEFDTFRSEAGHN